MPSKYRQVYESTLRSLVSDIVEMRQSNVDLRPTWASDISPIAGEVQRAAWFRKND